MVISNTLPTYWVIEHFFPNNVYKNIRYLVKVVLFLNNVYNKNRRNLNASWNKKKFSNFKKLTPSSY